MDNDQNNQNANDNQTPDTNATPEVQTTIENIQNPEDSQPKTETPSIETPFSEASPGGAQNPITENQNPPQADQNTPITQAQNTTEATTVLATSGTKANNKILIAGLILLAIAVMVGAGYIFLQNR